MTDPEWATTDRSSDVRSSPVEVVEPPHETVDAASPAEEVVESTHESTAATVRTGEDVSALHSGGSSGVADPSTVRHAREHYAATAGPTTPRTPRAPRRAHLAVRRVDPWSVCKFSFVVGVCLFVVLLVAVVVLYVVLAQLGVFTSLDTLLRSVTSIDGSGRTGTGGVEVVFSAGRVIGGTAVLGAVNVVLGTVLATVGAFLYNLCAEFTGGVEVTLGERE